MTPKSIVSLAVMVLTLPPHVDGQIKKYDIKSGIITFVETTARSGMRVTKKLVLYFDDYGMKERKDVYEGDRIMETSLSDGRTLYTIVHAEKAAHARSNAANGTELRFDWQQDSVEGARDRRVRKLPSITLVGKKCESFERISSSEKIVLAGWGHICLMRELIAPNIRKNSTAVSIEENVDIPEEKFNVPRGYSIR